jgi:dephospho-CoA kinase
MLEKKLRKVLERLQQVHHVRIASAMSYLGVVMSIAINFSGIFNRRYLSNRFILSMASILAAQQVRSLSAISPLQIGLTGSIGMGKSTCTKHFRAMGFPVFDADAAVHELYSLNGAAVEPIGRLFPDAIVDSAVSRPILASKIRDDITVLKALEEIVHPLVVAKRRQFFETAESEGNFMVVYDIPLLLENPANHNVDYTVVATASAGIQRSRVLSRPGMTEERFETLLSKQMPDEKKRELSDYLIHTDHESYAPSRAQVAKIVASIIEKNPAAWSQWKSRTTTTASNMNNAGKCIFSFHTTLHKTHDCK